MSPEIARSTARGVGWMIAARGVVRLVDLVTLGVAARLLAPTDFGVFALAMVVVSFIDLLGSLSFDLSLLQKADAERKHYDAAWTMTLIQRCVAAALTLALALPAAAIFQADPIAPIMLALAAGSLIEGLQNVGLVDFRRQLQFDREFSFEAARKGSAALATLAGALVFEDYRGLVCGVVAGKIAGVVLSYLMHPFRPRFGLSGGRELIHFSKWIFVSQSLSFLNHKFSQLAIGRLAGARLAGHYAVAYDLANAATTEIVYPTSRAMFPAYARIAELEDRVHTFFLAVLGLVAILAVPVGVGISATARPLVGVLLGGQWEDTVQVMRVLAVGGAVNALLACAGPVYPALGRPGVSAAVAGLVAAIQIPGTIVAVRQGGVLGAALFQAGVSVLFLPIVFSIASRIMHLPARSMIRAVSRPVAAGAVMGLLLWAAEDLGRDLPVAVELGLKVLAGAGVYTAALLALWRRAGRPAGPERWILDRLGRSAGVRSG
ncbi:MAG: oligosaccharide flippase family protein [Deltaproteobacteria bacterium]|nr:oligosaccharide flippase family protein [Deltaproteobacteria bacterium]